jgi:hypothetical protein
MTVLVGSLPCQLPVEGKRSRRQEPNHHMEEQMLQASSNTPDGRAKWPQLMSAEGREIIGPGFCPGPRVCVARLENRNGCRTRQLGPAEKATAPGTAPELSYPIFMPKSSTHHMHNPRSIVPHIRPKVLTDNQMS